MTVARRPVDALHADVHHDDIGLAPSDLVDDFVAVGAFADDGEFGVGGDQAPHAFADDLLVVDEQHADHVGILACSTHR